MFIESTPSSASGIPLLTASVFKMRATSFVSNSSELVGVDAEPVIVEPFEFRDQGQKYVPIAAGRLENPRELTLIPRGSRYRRVPPGQRQAICLGDRARGSAIAAPCGWSCVEWRRRARKGCPEHRSRTFPSASVAALNATRRGYGGGAIQSPILDPPYRNPPGIDRTPRPDAFPPLESR